MKLYEVCFEYEDEDDANLIKCDKYNLQYELDRYMSEMFSDWDYPLDFTLHVREVLENGYGEWVPIEVDVESIPNFLFRLPEELDNE